EKLGLHDQEAEDYARTVVAADLAMPGEEDVFRKVRADFDANSIQQSDHQIRRTMDELMAKAVDQIQNAQR
ncbi:MAG: ATPase inhibitor subunit zeta, partial [Aestuariivirgaceae bacterium]